MTNTAATGLDGSAGDLTIRPAVVGDAAALSAFAAATFNDTFAADNDPMDMHAYLSEAFSTSRQADELADPDRLCLLMENGSAIVGYALLRHASSYRGESGERTTEIQRFYVAAQWHGRGAAQRLMDACLLSAREQRATSVWLGVWERNPRAIRFYVKRGFADVGSQEFRLGSDLQTDRVMSRPVGER